MNTYYFTNNTDKEFTCLFNKQKFTFSAGQKVMLTEEKAKHFSKHLARSVARDQGITNSKTITSLADSFVVSTKSSNSTTEGNIADLENEALVIEAEKETILEPVTEQDDVTNILKKAKKKAAFE